jgi:universal stress protein F
MFKTILVPVDLSDKEASEVALRRAIELATASEGTIRLIHVRSILPVTYMEFVPPDFDAGFAKECEEKLRDVALALPFPQERVSYEVRMGSVYGEILQAAESLSADLIIVGSHRPTMATYLLGSNAATIVRHALCSVLVVREPQ